MMIAGKNGHFQVQESLAKFVSALPLLLPAHNQGLDSASTPAL